MRAANFRPKYSSYIFIIESKVESKKPLLSVVDFTSAKSFDDIAYMFDDENSIDFFIFF